MEKRFNTGVLFAAKAKTNPKAPDYSGELLIDLNSLNVKDGKVEIRLAGWKRQTKTGATFLSLLVDTYKPKPQPQKSQTIEDMEDDVPF